MFVLSNKKNILAGTTLFILCCEPLEAMWLNLNDNRSLDVSGADYVDIHGDVPITSPAFSDQTTIYLYPEVPVNLNLHYQNEIELLWNGLPVDIPDYDSYWLFVNGLCDQAESIRVYPKAENWNLVLPDKKCFKPDTGDSLTVTIITIKHKPSATPSPTQPNDYRIDHDLLKSLLDPSLPRSGAVVAVDPGLTDISSLQFPFLRLKAEQQAFLDNPQSNGHTHNEIAVFIINTGISKGSLRHVSGGAQMNQVVSNASSEKALYNLIIDTMFRLGFTTKKGSRELGLEQFLAMVQGPDGLVNVQKVINFMKEVIRRYRSDIKKEDMPRAIIEIADALITAQQSAQKTKDKEEPMQDQACGTTLAATSHALPTSIVPVTQMELVCQLIRAENNNANRIVSLIFLIAPRLQRKLGYAQAKAQIKNEDDTINPIAVFGILNQTDNWERRLQAALQPTPPEEPRDESRRKPRSKKPSSEGPLKKK